MKILAIAAHPDDETLGCGGTLLRMREEGHSIFWLIATAPVGPEWDSEVVRRKEQEVDAVAAAYGMDEVFRLMMPTTRLDTLPLADLINGIRGAVDRVRPEEVYVVHNGDVHTDHQVVFTATMSVLKAFYMKRFGVRRVLSFECLSSTEAAPPLPSRAFLPNVYRDIGTTLERKLELLARFESEEHRDPFPRGPGAVRALARLRGAAIGVEYAEAFMLIRDVG